MPKRPPVFRPVHAPNRAEQRRVYDERRGTARSRGYDGRWEKARRTHLARDPLCRGCEAMGEVVPATIVDHVVPHDGDQAVFWDTSWWQSCCAWHHSQVKQQLEAQWRAGRLDRLDLWLDSPRAVKVGSRNPRVNSLPDREPRRVVR